MRSFPHWIDFIDKWERGALLAISLSYFSLHIVTELCMVQCMQQLLRNIIACFLLEYEINSVI